MTKCEKRQKNLKLQLLFESNRCGYQTKVGQSFCTTIGFHWKLVTTTAGNVISIFVTTQWITNLSFRPHVEDTQFRNVVDICSVNLVISLAIPDIDVDIKLR